MDTIVKQVHLTAQYLATANINFVTKKDDDSHSNVGFNTEKGYLETWPLNDKGYKMAFEYATFSLHWLINDEKEQSLNLDGKTHQDAVQWISDVTAALGAHAPYTYRLHYELPYENSTDEFVFQKPSQQELNGLLELRTIAKNALERVVKDLHLATDIRIWPHHFDIGGFTVLDAEKNISVGFGMAIADTVVDDFYLYTSGYKNHDGIDTVSFEKPTSGTWKNEGFKGAVAPMKDMNEAKAIAFFKETISAYKTI